VFVAVRLQEQLTFGHQRPTELTKYALASTDLFIIGQPVQQGMDRRI
jgi:hypothetical protein